MRSLVTGANGFLGSHLVETLLAAGDDVRCLTRRSSDRRWLDGLPVEYAWGDVTDPDSSQAATRGVDRVFHLAGLTKALHPRQFFAVNAGGTANVLVAAADRTSPPRVVVVSSLAAIGPAPSDQPPTEETPGRPITPYGESKLAAEKVAAQYRDRLPLTIVRPPTIYGRRDPETLPFYRLAKWGLRVVVGGDRRLSLVEATDVARALLLVANAPSAIGRTYFVANHEPVSLDRLLVLIALAVGTRTVRLPVPAGLIVAAGALNGQIARARGRPHMFDRDKARDIVARHWVCDARRIQQELDFAPMVPLAEGICRVAEWYRQVGWL
ncbi:MAG: NAD-dependent epimerase/dehydratase family protein [Chloroflexi bacterium]|nr:NAD-dependent epimerase/dehydratase family protein [Chloroflexota bacterium]